ncbi:hypothetical protein IW262DRAFT_215256 [Armillaria fumosa]|nr:hypothetical protein IW262DRAFT_215256 [Armillaria fumosa]
MFLRFLFLLVSNDEASSRYADAGSRLGFNYKLGEGAERRIQGKLCFLNSNPPTVSFLEMCGRSRDGWIANSARDSPRYLV